jgi:hypothetical protein
MLCFVPTMGGAKNYKTAKALYEATQVPATVLDISGDYFGVGQTDQCKGWGPLYPSVYHDFIVDRFKKEMADHVIYRPIIFNLLTFEVPEEYSSNPLTYFNDISVSQTKEDLVVQRKKREGAPAAPYIWKIRSQGDQLFWHLIHPDRIEKDLNEYIYEEREYYGYCYPLF